MRSVDVCAQMDACADLGDICVRSLVHGFKLFQLQARIAGPGGEIRGNRHGNIVDGHIELLLTKSSSRLEQNQGVGVFVGKRVGVPEKAGMDIGV